MHILQLYTSKILDIAYSNILLHGNVPQLYKGPAIHSINSYYKK